MKLANLESAIREAKRFVAKAEAYKESVKDQDFPWGNQYSAAARRASMDLTRALAQMRKEMFR